MKAYEFIPALTANSAVVFASPHSGRDYPVDLLRDSILDPLALRSSEDAYVDTLLRSAPREGAPTLLGGVPRCYVDYNRSEGELDPLLIKGITPGGLNPRVSAGLGVIPRVVAGGRPIYRRKLTRLEAEHRLQRYWHPYHAKLDAILAEHRTLFGRAILIDMHSMPRDAISMSLHGIRAGKRPDVVLGDRFGASCSPDITDAITRVFQNAGLKVAHNAPFAGAYVAQRYGMPSMGTHVVQIELDRGLYLDEGRVRPKPGFEAFCHLMDHIIAELAQIGRSEGHDLPLAAE